MLNSNSNPQLAQSLMRLSMDHQTRLFQVIEAIQERVKKDRVTHGLTEVALSMIRDNDLEEKLSVVIEDLAEVSMPDNNQNGALKMANENVTQRDQITSALNYAEQLSMIMQWIENARLVLDAVELAKNNDRELAASCDKHSIPFGNADWDVEQSDALSFLCIMQMDYLSRATEINETMEVANV